MFSGEPSHKVSIIVVNWNGERFLKDFLGALLSQRCADCEIILVDNGSSDNSVRFTRDNFPGIKIVALSGGAL
jgi:GT2 family glycosyltransferase